MSKRDWLFFTAVGGFLALALVYAGSLNEHGSASGSYQSAAEIHTEADRIETQFPAAQSLKADPEATQDERERRDLAAQEGMALWAERLFWITFAGVVLLALTFLEAWKTAVAAQEMATTTRTSAEKQLRAYVTIQSVHITNFRRDELVLFDIKMKNCGQTPAYKYRGWYSFACMTGDAIETYSFPDGETYSITTLGPGIESSALMNRSSKKLSEQESAEVRAGSKYLVVWGKDYYVDAFCKAQEMAFRYRHTGKITYPQRMEACAEGNYTT